MKDAIQYTIVENVSTSLLDHLIHEIKSVIPRYTAEKRKDPGMVGISSQDFAALGDSGVSDLHTATGLTVVEEEKCPPTAVRLGVE